jgi:alpha-glucosidase (family GH31 glycosyl hydrolase)
MRRQLISYKRFGQVFPDWFAPKTQRWWTKLLSDWFTAGVQFSGIWLDMNEVSSFCDGSWSAQFILAPLIHDDDRFTAVVPAQI